jgi:hypothetical protein
VVWKEFKKKEVKFFMEERESTKKDILLSPVSSKLQRMPLSYNKNSSVQFSSSKNSALCKRQSKLTTMYPKVLAAVYLLKKFQMLSNGLVLMDLTVE